MPKKGPSLTNRSPTSAREFLLNLFSGLIDDVILDDDMVVEIREKSGNSPRNGDFIS